MPFVTTARILTDRALLRTCGQECVDWAIGMLEMGHNGYYLAILAGMSPPFYHFEVRDARDRALQELGLSDTSDAVAITSYVAECLRHALSGDADLAFTLGVIKDLCIARGYARDLYDFYLLYFAYTDLMGSEVQWYWDGANRSNIVSIIRTRAEAFLQSIGNT